MSKWTYFFLENVNAGKKNPEYTNQKGNFLLSSNLSVTDTIEIHTSPLYKIYLLRSDNLIRFINNTFIILMCI